MGAAVAKTAIGSGVAICVVDAHPKTGGKPPKVTKFTLARYLQQGAWGAWWASTMGQSVGRACQGIAM